MTAGAAPDSGRRAGLGAAAVLAGFLLLVPSLYLLGPFALLMLLARPRAPRELFWLVLAAAGVALSLAGDQTLVPQLFRTGSLVMSAAFALLSLRRTSGLVSRLLVALAISIGGVLVWAQVWGVTWPDIESAFIAALRSDGQSWASSRPGDADIQLFVQQAQALAPRAARLLPGMLALQAMAGCALAWVWHHRLSSTPLGRAPGKFRDFRFNDHLIWGAIITLGSLLLPLPPLARTIAANLLIVGVGLYTVRGLAVISAIFEQAPSYLRILAMALASPICAILGVADTWLDFRGRLAPSASGGA